MNNRTLKVRMIQYNLIIVSAVAMLFSVITYASLNIKVSEIAENSLVNHVNSIAYRYEIAYEEMMNIVINCTERNAFSLDLVGRMETPEQRKKGLEYAALVNDFCAITGYSRYINSMVIFNDSGTLIQATTSRGSFDDVERILKNDWFYRELQQPNDGYQLNLYKNPFFGETGDFLPIARTLSQDRGTNRSWVLLGLSGELFNNVLKQEDSGNQVIVVTHTGERIASIHESEEQYEQNQQLVEELLGNQEKQGRIRKFIHGGENLIAFHKYPRSGIMTIEILRMDTLLGDNMLIVRTILLMSIICLIMGLLLSVYFTRKVEKPVKQLVVHIARIASGDFSINSRLESEDEIGMIGKGINQMSEQISVLMNERIKDEKEKSNLELQMLQAQINPHFLYNTLDSIKWIAVIQKNSGIVKVVTALSGLLKNMAKGFNEQVTLRKELDFLNDYVTIEKIKYVEMFDLDIVVEDDRLYNAMVMKLTLQPLVENSIFSGIEPGGRNGLIKIRIYTESDILYMMVWDNGVGIPPEKMAGLLQDRENLKGNRMSSIGLANVDRRIKLTYGGEYGLTIESTVGEFTRITVKQPLGFERGEW